MTSSKKEATIASQSAVDLLIRKAWWKMLRSLGRNRASWNGQYLSSVCDSVQRSDNTLSRVIELCNGGKLIEFGCGDGSLPRLLPNDAFTFYKGFDISDVAIARARHLAQRSGLNACEFYQVDMTQWRGDSSISLILLEECLYYLNKREQVEFLGRCCRSLGPEGLILVVVHDGDKHSRTLITCRNVCSVVAEEVISHRSYLTLARKAGRGET